jgi:hypothetical protein
MMTTRRPNGTFINSPGRTKGARNRLASRVFEDIFAHWCEPTAPGGNMCKGQEALETLYGKKSPASAGPSSPDHLRQVEAEGASIG